MAQGLSSSMFPLLDGTQMFHHPSLLSHPSSSFSTQKHTTLCQKMLSERKSQSCGDSPENFKNCPRLQADPCIHQYVLSRHSPYPSSHSCFICACSHRLPAQTAEDSDLGSTLDSSNQTHPQGMMRQQVRLHCQLWHKFTAFSAAVVSMPEASIGLALDYLTAKFRSRRNYDII